MDQPSPRLPPLTPFAAILACAVSALGALPDGGEDWTEIAAAWHAQSYWQDQAILQEYAFSPCPDDKVAGAGSVLVHMRVAAERPKEGVELRLVPPEPLDLSEAEAVEVSLKLLNGGTLRPTNVYFCNPGFTKLAIATWPAGVSVAAGEGWQRVLLDLTDVRVLDKAKPGVDGEYHRKDVSTICLNFALPPGPVDAQLLVDAMRVAKLPPSPVVREELPDGSFVFRTANYTVVVGGNGYLQSLRAGGTEFLRPHRFGPADTDAAVAPSASACCEDSDPKKAMLVADEVAPKGRSRLTARHEQVSLRYEFREVDFDISVAQTFTPRAGLLFLALSPEVVAALDGRTDQALRAETLEAGPQINTRLMARTGAVLECRQYTVGYSRMSLGALRGGVWSFRFLSWGSGRQKLTLRPVAQPTAADAVGFEIDCASPDFLLPGGAPVRFDVVATSYATQSLSGAFAFEVCDYLTRAVVGGKRTTFILAPGQSMSVPTAVPLAEPGPYRGRLTVSGPPKRKRSVEWVFTHDFASYRPASVRPPDFADFWRRTLDELGGIPMDAQLTPVPEASTGAAEATKVSLATLAGRRVHCWYWRPRKPGRYPARFEVPSSGVYPRTAAQVPHGTDHVGMWMAIHGLPVDFDPKQPPEDPAAWNYWTHGIESRETSMWRVIYASLVRGVDFLCSRDEVDADRIMVSGGSQGGGLSMVLAGLDRRIAFAAPAHSGLARLDWTVLHKPGFWPFGMDKKPAVQSQEQFLRTLSYFDAASFTPDIACPVFAEVSLLDTVTASGNQICALAHVKPGLLELICDPWRSHASSPRGSKLRAEAINRWLRGEPPVQDPIK